MAGLTKIITGVNGSVTIPVAALQFATTAGDPVAVDIRVIRWRMVTVRETHRTTTFAVTDNFHTKAGGMVDYNGGCEGFLDSSHFLDVGQLETEDQVPASFVLTSISGNTYTFDALMSNVAWAIDKVAHSSMSFDFEGSGPIVGAAA